MNYSKDLQLFLCIIMGETVRGSLFAAFIM
jgi:hypothetical protein